MYRAFFGLKHRPFALTADPHFFFPSTVHQMGLHLLCHSLRSRDGICVLTGDIGAGKTTLLQTICKTMHDELVPAVVLNPFLEEEDLYQVIIESFKLPVPEGTKVTAYRLTENLQAFLQQQDEAGKIPLLAIDEAQNLSLEVLEKLRMLSNIHGPSHPLLQVLLVGQHGLLALLESRQLIQFNQRITVKYHLRPVNVDEVSEYISFRLQVDSPNHKVRFEAEAFDSIYNHSGGVPRIINVLCDKSLLGAFALRTHRITAAVVEKAATNLRLASAEVT